MKLDLISSVEATRGPSQSIPQKLQREIRTCNMDPASIIGTTSGVLSFITFCVQAVQVGQKVHRSAVDATDDTGANEYTQCKRFCQTFQPTLERLRKQANNSGKNGISNAEESLLRIVTLCDSVGAEIIVLMEKYELQQPSDPGLSRGIRKRIGEKIGVGKHVIRVTLRALWDHEEAKELRTRFNECVGQLGIHLSEVNKQEILGEIHNIAHSVKYLQRETPALRTSLERSLTRLDEKNEKLGSQIEELVEQIDSAGSSLSEQLNKLAQNLDHITNLHKAMNTVFELSQDTLENINRSRILKAISFPTRLSRQSQINQRSLPDETFEWFIRDEAPPSSDSSSGPGPLTSFRQWLREGEGIFHITGKPGSAKSTLMNFLQNHEDTEAMLRLWSSHMQTITSDAGAGSSEDKITIASTFLYNAANSENEKSAEGIYRTLLYTILEDHRQDLISTVFERYWNPWSWTPWVEEQKDITISGQELANAFDLVLRETNTSGWRYCIFIDGADEFQDRSMDKWKFANEIRRWTTEYRGTVKVCVSSREERPWIDESFCPDHRRIKIHQYTKGDIKKLVEDRIADHHNLQEPRFGREEKADFIMTIVTKAEGVFLWVRHVLDLVVEQLDENQDIETLNQVLDTLPLEMEKMIDAILSRIQKINKEESVAIFKILLLKETWPRGLALSLAHYSMVKDLIKNPKFSQKPIPGDRMGRCMGDADSPISGQIDRFRGRFHLLFRGLVDVVTQPAPVYSLSSPWKKPPCGPCLNKLSHSLSFSHRSIYEYLRKRETYLAGSEDTVLTIIKCLTAQTNMGWCFAHGGYPSGVPGDILMDQYVHGIVPVIRDTLRDGRNTSSARAVFTSLDDLDSSLISRLLMMNKRAAKANSGRRGYIPTVFAISCTMGLDSYVEWVLSNRPEEAWMGMREELQAIDLWKVCDLFMDLVPRGETGASWHDPEPRVEAATMIQRLLKAGFSPNSPLGEKPDMATPWLAFLGRFIRWCFLPDALLWRIIDALLRSGAPPPEAFSWEMIPCTESPNKFKVSFRLRDDEQQAVDEHRRTENEAERVEDLEPEEEIVVTYPTRGDIVDVYARPVRKFPDNKATLRDIFCVFGPKDEPDVAATLEALYPDPEPEHEAERENDGDTGLSNSETSLTPGTMNGEEATTAEPYLGSQEDTQPDLLRLLKLKRRDNTSAMIVESPVFKTVLGTVVGGVLGATVMYVIMRRTEGEDTR
ncbi:hypothetical protein QBC37DRAFT_176051 [Rhypophila decipiens]|uniref:Nephrocystin 3-like N-terminal domain-containing protein n=1 Tax=Rhypophila decipiens TaxID=261697 RepID=A0AAN6Y8A5_9PEZI|nr:hypothetical protein QBC37DRAFT_176051 [Rhypophila decipiens]